MCLLVGLITEAIGPLFGPKSCSILLSRKSSSSKLSSIRLRRERGFCLHLKSVFICQLQRKATSYRTHHVLRAALAAGMDVTVRINVLRTDTYLPNSTSML
ncbi:hypothetical protein VTI28DRAFT_2007 [Corynascus sepedonium]